MTPRAFGRIALVACLLALVFVPACRAQGITDGSAPRMLWTEPPSIGMYSPGSARVDDALPIIASADWPPSADTAMVELRKCTRLQGAGIEGWELRTVRSAFFRVRVWNRYSHEWEDRDAFYGFTFPHVKRVYVVQWAARSRGLIKHEMLHILLAAHGFDPAHGTPVAEGMFKRCFPEGQ